MTRSTVQFRRGLPISAVMPSTPDTAELPAPSRAHATCAWCGTGFPSIVELIDHVDRGHVDEQVR